MFQKLKNNVLIDSYEPLEETVCYGQDVDGQFKGITYHFVKTNKSQELFSLIPMRYRRNFYTQVMRINTEIPPHTDSGITFTINCYVQTDNCVTQFYNINTNKPNTTKMVMQTTGRIYQEEDLEPTEYFIAKPGEVWILDVSRPHSIKPLGQMKERVAITLSSMKYNYNDVCSMLHEMGSL